MNGLAKWEGGLFRLATIIPAWTAIEEGQAIQFGSVPTGLRPPGVDSTGYVDSSDFEAAVANSRDSSVSILVLKALQL